MLISILYIKNTNIRIFLKVEQYVYSSASSTMITLKLNIVLARSVAKPARFLVMPLPFLNDYHY